MVNDLHHIRKEYTKFTLDDKGVAKEPIVQFERWWEDAMSHQVPEINAMTLCTVDEHQQPHGRIVLLKEYNQDGFVFFTNYNSSKSRQLSYNAKASLVFFWSAIERQVNIQGTVEKIDPKDSEIYFHERPFASQVASFVSQQSSVIESREVIEQKFKEVYETYKEEQKVPYPSDRWGGFRLIPHRIEFWQGRASRLHDRIQYTRVQDNQWTIERLSP